MKNKKGISKIYIIIFILLVVAFVGYALYDNIKKSNANLFNPGVVIKTTTAKPTPTKVVNIQITSTTYPNPILTPGNVLTMDSDLLCIPGESEKLNNVPESMIKQVFKNYNIKYPTTKEYAVDHFIPLNLGGSNDIKNLWPQGATPLPGYKEKNIAEKYLYTLMCNKTINISEAQQRIKTDWVLVYKEAIK